MNEGQIYWNSLAMHGGATLFIAKNNGVKSLYVFGGGEAFNALEGEAVTLPGGEAKRCPLNNANAAAIRRLFPFANPERHKGRAFTLGLGDRLGLASAGHLRLIRDMDVFPVLAQQSIRELNLTGRTYDDVLSAAVWAVFQEGYRKGWGADGDHLKTAAEVGMALDCGFTMITLDCSEHIRNDLAALPDAELWPRYNLLDAAERASLEAAYLGKTFPLEGGGELTFSPPELRRIVLVYLNAVKFAADVYNTLLRGKDADFELSIDETLTATSPQAHYFAANELLEAGAAPVSVAPRFCGEFQKGIDYRGDPVEFEREFSVHAGVARTLGHKLSIHSGSDKFSVFPIIYRETGGNVHVKTAGTNWLEAVRVIARARPELFREVFRFALNNLPEAKKYYHITENAANIPDIDALGDAELPALLDQDDARQAVHVTYGLILSAKNQDGSPKFKEAIYAALNEREDEYYAALAERIGRHLPR